MLKSIIIDSDAENILRIQSALSEHGSEIKIAATAASILEGIKLVHVHQPEIVFLNTILPDGNGLELLHCIPNHRFKTIFIGAGNDTQGNENHTSNAWFLESNFNTEALTEALNSIKESLHKNQQSKAFSGKSIYGLKLPVSTNEGLHFIPFTEIIHIKGQGSYTLIFTLHDKPLLVSKNLKEYEIILEDKGFCRVHNSHIINLGHVKRFVGATHAFAVMCDGSEVEVSKNRREIFLNLMADFCQ